MTIMNIRPKGSTNRSIRNDVGNNDPNCLSWRPVLQLDPLKVVISLLALCTLVVYFISSGVDDRLWIQAKLSNVNQSSSSVPNNEIHYNEITTKNSSYLEPSRFIIDPDPNASYPKVAWLMSYPNSGTSFTMQLVHREGKRATASNYGLEDKSNSMRNVPLYNDSPNGPYLVQPNETVPSAYILTKTHCGGRCVDCGPEKYMENEKSFISRCAQGSRKKFMKGTNNKTKEIVYYDPHLTQRAIHLIRNPFDNIVSNFHLERHKRTKSNRTQWLSKYTNDKKGFRKWCSYMDKIHLEQEKELLPKDFVLIFTNEQVPCHAHFYRYAKWHDYAINTIKELKLPSITLFYEDYERNMTKITQDIFQFLDLSVKNDGPTFLAGKTYIDHFHDYERQTAFRLMSTLVRNDTWKLIRRYSDKKW